MSQICCLSAKKNSKKIQVRLSKIFTFPKYLPFLGQFGTFRKGGGDYFEPPREDAIFVMRLS